MRTTYCWSICVLLLCTGSPSEAIAQTAQETPAEINEQPTAQQEPQQTAPPAPSGAPVQLEEITVTATKSEERAVADIPGHVSVIDRQDIERYQPQDVADLLRYEPGVDIALGPRRINERPFIRGLGGDRILLTVDGARLNFNTAHRGNMDFVDVESLDQLEIIRGPSSALYGSGAMGGTINMLTKNGSDMLRPGRTIGARARWSFNSNNRELAEHVSLYGVVKERFDYIFSYTRRDASDVRTGDGRIDNSGYRLNDVFLKGRYFLYAALVGQESSQALDFPTLQQAYAQATKQHNELRRSSPVDLLTAFLCGPDQVARWTAGVSVNTEDNGWIEYRSPLPFHLLYTKNDLAVASLTQLLAYRESVESAVMHLDATARGQLERAYQARSLAFAGLMLLHEERATAAHDHYQQAYALNPRDTFAAQHMRDTWLASAAGLVQEDRYDEAKELVFRVLSLTPDSLPGRFLLAQTLLAEGQPHRALAEFQTIAARAPAYPGVQDALSYARRHVSHLSNPPQGEIS